MFQKNRTISSIALKGILDTAKNTDKKRPMIKKSSDV